ncbi:hypothetical protein FISHEDRAFT_74144 [Fistulina hepatica ATCC 64428]|uniref:Uncharacterized protein n=1 Tax=Fistulina hepatica ATCC 64428 TaxID=1128425 RepID=A0A0D7AC22_9AGAR|nr:hypothetical protein FISHEDRAFT_74144 [Fistulina hepatica ATCC 64428]
MALPLGTPPAHLWTPPCPHNYSPPTWDELRGQSFSPTLLRDVEARRALGPAIDPGSPGANLYSNLAQIVFNCAEHQRAGNAMRRPEHFYPEALSILELPAGDPRHQDSMFVLADQYITALKCMVRDATALLDHVTNGASIVALIHPNSRLRNVPAGNLPADTTPVHSTVFTTPRFINSVPHSLHMPLRAALDTIAHVYSPAVIDSYKRALENADAHQVPQEMPGQGPCAWMPPNTAFSQQYLLPMPSEYPWKIQHLLDGATFPPQPDEDDALEVAMAVSSDSGLALALKRLQHENDDLKVQVAALQPPTLTRLVLDYSKNQALIASLKSEVQVLQRTNGQHLQLCQDLAVAMFLPHDAYPPSDRKVLFERLFEAANNDGSGGRMRWRMVSQQAWDSQEERIAVLSHRLRYVQGQLEGERALVQRVEGRSQEWRARVQLYAQYAANLAPVRWGDVRRIIDLPAVEDDDWKNTLGARTHEYLYDNRLEYMVNPLYRAFSCLSPSYWVTALQNKLHAEDVNFAPGLVLAVGADLITGKIGAYNSAGTL